MSRKPRSLTDDELTLWRHVTRQITRRFGAADHRVTLQQATATPRHPEPEPSTDADVSPRRSAPTLAPLMLGATDGIDRRTAKRFSRGELAVDARLDLHGLTLAEAQPAVARFLRRAASEGRRFVILVTGKGNPGPSGQGGGRIRSEAMHWLAHASLRPLILAVREAPARHGGSGGPLRSVEAPPS